MTDLEKLRQWLLTFPKWEDTLQVEYTEAEPGSAGLFPLGLEEVSRREDVLGNVQVACRYRFSLYRRTTRQQETNAQWLLEFQNWVQQQSVDGKTPRFGDVPEAEKMRAEKGTLQNHAITDTFAVTLIAEFMKVYEVNE